MDVSFQIVFPRRLAEKFSHSDSWAKNLLYTLLQQVERLMVRPVAAFMLKQAVGPCQRSGGTADVPTFSKPKLIERLHDPYAIACFIYEQF